MCRSIEAPLDLRKDRSMLLRIAVTLLIAPLLGIAADQAAAQSPAPPDAGQAPAALAPNILDTDRCGDYFIAIATIDGEGPFRMLLDTGASVTIVSPDTAARADIGGRIREIKIGDLKLSGTIRYQTRDISHISRALGTHIDGILGHPVLRAVLLTYDYPAGEVRYGIGELTEDMPGIAPMAKGNRPFIGALIGDDKTNVLLDTGFSGGLSLEDFDDLPFAADPIVTGVRTRIDGLSLGRSARLAADMTFGPFTVATPVVSNAERSSLLGTAILRDFLVTVDQQSGLVQMVRPDGTAQQAPIEIGSAVSFGVVSVPLFDGNRIERIVPGSSAERAGLQPGDVVIAIDGEPVAQVRCEARTVEIEAGDTAVYTIRRGADRFEVELEAVVIVP
ncbi:MAG: PDZ domain-containing protein [Planctomycetota bacterium]